MRPFYLSVEGARQGRFKGGVTHQDHQGKLLGLGFEQRIASPRDIAGGARGGRRSHQPILLRRPVDAATPQFLHAACSGEQLKTVLCEFPHRPGDGGEEVAFTVKLEGAVVSAHRIVHAESADGSGAGGTGLVEEIELAFQRIEWEHRPGKTLASDSWER